MRIFCLIGCLVWSVSCDSEQIYTAQNMQDAVAGNSSEAVIWRYTVVMNRLLQRDFDATEITKPQFIKNFSQKAMDLVNQQLTKNISTAIKVGTILTTLKGQFPAGSPESQGLGKIVDAATALGLNTDKSKNKELSDNMNKAIVDFFSDASLRQALADKGGFISTRLKGPPDLVAEVLNQEFINEVLAIQETSQLQKVVDIPTMFAEFNKTMHVVLNDKELMITMTDPTIVNDVGAVLQAFFKLYKDLRADKDNHDVNTIKAQVASMFSSFNAKRHTAASTLSAALWNAAHPVQFKNLKHTDACSSNQWQAVQDLDGNSLVANLPEAAITMLSLCRVSVASCDTWGAWDIWLPLADTVCIGETLTQTRIRSRTCPVPCTGNDCNPTDTETQEVDGTKVCAPTCESSCEQACKPWKVWESKAWSPSTDSVCGGQKMRQRKSRAQRRTCANLCEDKDCNIFEILPAGKRTVEGTGDCDTTPPPTCKCCDSQNREITSCPTDSRLTWDATTCSCGQCSKETIMACGGVYSSGKLHNDRALDENCACYYKTSKQGWAGAILFGTGRGKELLDADCALQNVDAFKDSSKGRSIRTALWDDGCVHLQSFGMTCNASKAAKIRQNFIDFHDLTNTRQTSGGYWGLGGCTQVFKHRRSFELRIMKTILTCGDHSYNIEAWEQIGKPPHFDRIYKSKPSTFLERKIPEWGEHLQICLSDYQKNRND